MAANERLDLKFSAAEAIQHERQISLSQHDFAAFHVAIAQPFTANPAQQRAMEQAHTRT